VLTLCALARAFGGEIVGRDKILCPGPGHGAKDRSLQITVSAISPDGFLCHSFAGDDFRACRDYIRKRLNLPSFGYNSALVRRERPAKSSESDQAEDRKREAALRIWAEARDLHGSIVPRYLKDRGLALPTGVANKVLRFHPDCPWRERESLLRVPAMVALMRDIVTDEPCGIHRTRLTEDGRKVDRRMLGDAAGAAIKIDDDTRVTIGLTIGEGFETCLAGRQIGFRPVWALGSVGAIAKFPVLPGIEGLTILAEAGEASIRAVDECGTRWDAGGREVIIVDPRAGSDLNDAIREVAQ
jgi:putative DNA primase/helicase